MRSPWWSGAGVLILAVALGAVPVGAVTVRSWTPAARDGFAGGEFDGTALDADGYLRLGPAFDSLWGPETGVVWDVAVAVDGRSVFAALSGPGRVVRVTEKGETETWYESTDQVLVTAVAAAKRGGCYFGLSPDGDVVHGTAPDRRRTIVDTGAKFIWALLAGGEGDLWVGTGTPGRLLRHRGDRETETVFESGDDPIRSLAGLPDGGVVAGTGDRGRVIRFGADGRPFVLLDADESEIVSLAVAADGTVFALAAGAARQRPAGTGIAAPAGDRVTVRARAPEDDDEDRDAEPAPGAPAAGPGPAGRPARASGAGGSLYRIDRDGGVTRIWNIEQGVPYSVVALGDRVLVATGGEGRIFEVDREGRAAALIRFPSDEVVALAADPDGDVFVGGADDARVARIGPGPAASGSFETEPLDAEVTADWGNILWEADVPPGASLTLEVRAGNTEAPDGTWSEWARPEAADPRKGATAPAPPARWFQARVQMTPSPGAESPLLRRIEMFYLPRNRPPAIERLEVEPVGVAWTKAPVSSASRQGPLVADDPVSVRSGQSLQPKAGVPRILKAYEFGARTFSWQAADPDGDPLTYRLEIRRDGTDHWFPLAERLDDDFYSWDSRAMPDGVYRVRLTAGDGSANTGGREREATRVSPPFRLDNTPPSVGEFEVARKGGTYEVSFVALDPNGRIDAVEYAIDGEGWKRLDPLDGVTDSEREDYLLTIDAAKLPASTAHVMIRVTDSAGNLGGDVRPLGQ